MSIFSVRDYEVATIQVHVEEIAKDLGRKISVASVALLAEAIADLLDTL